MKNKKRGKKTMADNYVWKASSTAEKVEIESRKSDVTIDLCRIYLSS